MKNLIKSIVLFTLVLFIASCEKDEGRLPNISFKTGSGYVSDNATIAGGTTITIGVTASKAEEKDVLKKFNVSRSVNGASATTVFEKDLSGSEEDTYENDQQFTLDAVPGQTNTYTFSVTNRDGLTNQGTLTVTVQ